MNLYEYTQLTTYQHNKTFLQIVIAFINVVDLITKGVVIAYILLRDCTKICKTNSFIIGECSVHSVYMPIEGLFTNLHDNFDYTTRVISQSVRCRLITC